MLTSEEKDEIAKRVVVITLTMGEAGAVGIAIGQAMQRIEDGTFESLMPLNRQSLYTGMLEFAKRLQEEVHRHLSQHEVEDMQNFQKTVQAIRKAKDGLQ